MGYGGGLKCIDLHLMGVLWGTKKNSETGYMGCGGDQKGPTENPWECFGGLTNSLQLQT